MNGINESGSDDFFAGVPGFMQVFIVGFLVLFVCVVAFIIFTAIRNWRTLKSAGLDPLAAQSQIAGQVANSQLLAEEKSVEDRLRELDDLNVRGVISDEEHGTARAAVLRDN